MTDQKENNYHLIKTADEAAELLLPSISLSVKKLTDYMNNKLDDLLKYNKFLNPSKSKNKFSETQDNPVIHFYGIDIIKKNMIK